MLLYSLDEFGDFEGIKQENKPVFIAGLSMTIKIMIMRLLMKEKELRHIIRL